MNETNKNNKQLINSTQSIFNNILGTNTVYKLRHTIIKS